MRGLLANRFVQAALVLVLLAALVEVAGISHPVSFAAASPPRAAARAAVSVAERACPGPGSASPTGGGLAVASAPSSAGAASAGAGSAGAGSGGTGSGGTGQAAVIPLSPGGSAVAAAAERTVTQPGRLAVLRITTARALPKKPAAGAVASSVPTVPGRGGVMIQSAGPMAQGLEAEQTGAGGLVTGRCDAPGTDFWFAGPGTNSAAQIQLYLMNVDGQPANVAVTALTEGVPLLAGADAGIDVPPHSMVVQSLAKLMHGSTVIALHVSASAGRIVAAVRETRRVTQAGTWLPAAAPPANRLVIPALPGSPGSRELYIGVPGSQDAQVKLTAVTAKGSYQPTGGSGIALPGGSAVGIALPSLASVAAAVVVSSSVPVMAAMLVPGGAAGAPGAVSASALPVQQQGVIADNPPATAGSSELVLSAPRAAAQVRISLASSKSVLAGQAGKVVQVPAGKTVVVRLRPPPGTAKGASYSIMLTPLPGSGPLYAGRVLLSGGTVRSILPVLSSPVSVALPAVRDSLATVLP